VTKLTIAQTSAGFVVRCRGNLFCVCSEPVIANDVDLEEIPDGNGDKMINGLRLACSGCHAVLLEISIC
jgi:hypothetical protein